jgi:DNA repair photolyase
VESTRPRLASSAIQHILIDKNALDRFPERVEGILEHFPKVKPIIASDLNQETINRHFREAFPKADVPCSEKTSSTVSVGKRFLVIGAVEKEKSAEPFLDSKGMVCHGFHNINVMVNGCVYNCQYCFLQEHIWDKDISSFIKLNVNYEDILDRMREISGQKLNNGEATRYQMGVLMDSLGCESITHFIEFMTPLLGEEVFSRSTIELLSKGNDIRALLDVARKYPWATSRLFPGWSINSVYAANKYEIGTAGAVQRLEAARELQDAGYKIRFRIDPIIPYEGWKKDYSDLVDMIYEKFGLEPYLMIIASLRFDEPGLIGIAKERFSNSDLFSYDFPKEDKAKFRIPFDQRVEIFRAVIDRIHRHNSDQLIGICKENMKTWKALEIDPGKSCLSAPLLENTIDQFVLD